MPLFLKRSFNKFLLSTWHDSDHDHMLATIAAIRSMRHSDGSQALDKEAADSITAVEDIVLRYRKARTLASHTGFYGVPDAQSVIGQAGIYARDKWLSHCTSLVDALNEVKPKIAQSHYNYLVRRVDMLSNYRSYTYTYYDDTLVPQVDDELKQYENKAVALYGTRRDIDDLRNLARSYYSDALDYYLDN